MNGSSPHLTARELDVLAFLVAGMTNRDIAKELDLAESTVKYYLSSVYRRLGVSNRTEAALVGLGIFPMLRVLAS
jgi:DNA-binding NarL/FixJ family response regulator